MQWCGDLHTLETVWPPYLSFQPAWRSVGFFYMSLASAVEPILDACIKYLSHKEKLALTRLLARVLLKFR